MASIAQTIPDISNQALVQVEIANGKIYVYPEEVTVYYVWDPGHATPGLPHQVRWVSKGLQPGQFLRIVPKIPAHEFFGPGSNFEIPPGYNTVPSGPPCMRPSPPGKRLDWYYSIILFEREPGGKEREVCRLDPDVIIKDDP